MTDGLKGLLAALTLVADGVTNSDTDTCKGDFTMVKEILSSTVALAVLTGVALAAPTPPPPPSVNIQIGPAAQPRERVIVKETTIIKEKGDHGKHKGHYKEKKHKKHKKHD